MPWTKDEPPAVATNWTEDERTKCIAAANSVLAAGGTDEAAIFACIHAAGKAKEGTVKTVREQREAKEASLGEMEQRIRSAWYSTYRPATANGVEPVDGPDVWVREVYMDRVIVEIDGGLFEYGYTDADSGVTFGEPIEVEIAYIPKAAPFGKSRGMAVKMLSEDDLGAVIGGYMALFGNDALKDLQGDYFTPATELWLDSYTKAPALFHHGLDHQVGLAHIGHRVKSTVDNVGVWVEDWLDKSSNYWKMVKPLLDAEALYFSPGSAPHLVKRRADGELISFPIVEDTLTPVPAQHRLLPVEQIKATYKAAGIDLPAAWAEEADENHRGDGGPSRGDQDATKALALAWVEATIIQTRT